MRSHEYKFALTDLFRVVIPTLVVCCGLIGILKLGANLRLLPPAAAALDPNSTVLAHQARAACSKHSAQVLLIGDSTCLVGVDAAALSRELPANTVVLNLALLSWFDLRDYGELAAQFVKNHPGQVRAIVLLVTPEKLGMSRNEGQEQFWQEIRQKAQRQGSGHENIEASDRFGLRALRENLLGYLLATPLHGSSAGAAYFGFSSEVDAYMSVHQGTSLDLGELVRPKVTSKRAWQFAPDLQRQSEALRAQVPPGVKFIAGFTPIARAYSQATDRQRALEALHQWNRWLGADVLLTNLPITLPDVLFSSKAHLNESGQQRFTKVLAERLTVALGD
jgi:hypothetical protein